MKKRLIKLIEQYKEIFFIRENLISLIAAVIFFGGAVFVHNIANNYVVSIKGTPVGDLVLDYLPVIEIDGAMIQFAVFLTAISLFLAITKPKFIAFSLKTLSLFIIIRAFLISVTHLGANPDQLIFDSTHIGYTIYNSLYNTTNDFFFSAHTGAPFLGALIFWPNKKWRYFYIFASIISGASVLVAHIHYSIDVFAAPMIAHSIFVMSQHLFRRDYRLSREV